MKFIHLILLFFVAVTTSAFAQSKSGASPYVFPDFVTASVMQKGGGVTDASLNYNTLTQEMLFLQNGVKTVLDQSNVDTVFIQNKKFIPVGQVYYEKLTDVKINLFEQHINKRVPKKGYDPGKGENAAMTASFGYKKAVNESFSPYDLHLPDNYDVQPENVFWLQKGKSFIKVSDLKSILKVFAPNKEQSVDAYIKDNKLNIGQANDLAKLVIFCNLP